MNEQSINIALSGWSGGGTTTLALLLSLFLKKRYIYLGSVFRQLGQKLGYSEEGSSRPAFDDYIESIIGKTVDNYVDHKLLNDNGILVDADLGAFRIGKHPKVFSVFVKSAFEERLKRVKTDGREDADQFLKERDETLRKKYLELWNIDFFDQELIEKKYNLVIDNTNMTVENELRTVFSALKDNPQVQADFAWDKLDGSIEAEVAKFWAKGKDSLKNRLKRAKLLIEPHEMLLEMTQLFPEDVTQFPERIQNIFLGRE